MPVRDDGIHEGCMGMAARTQKTRDAEQVNDDLPIMVIDDMPVIGCISAAVSPGMAERASFRFRPERAQELFILGFCRMIVKI